MELQENLEAKSEELAKEAARTGQKVFAFVVRGESELIRGAFNIATFIPKTIIEGINERISGNKQYRGKQSVKQLVGSGAKLEDIPLKEEHVKDFKGIARKYGIDYSLKKVVSPQAENGEKETQYIVFYKAKDINVLQTAFKEYTAKIMDDNRRKSIKERLKEDGTVQKSQNRERKREKFKVKEAEL